MKKWLVIIMLSFTSVGQAEWTNSYPLIDNFGHHIYLEGFEIPILNAGVTDPAPSPDGLTLAFASRGWIWILDLQTSIATRVTQSSNVDARPAWSSNSKSLVFVRVDKTALSIVMLDIASGQETVLINSAAIHLDPSFSSNDEKVIYASAQNGSMGLWQYDLNTQTSQPIISQDDVGRREVLRRPKISADGSTMLYINKQNTKDSIKAYDIQSKRIKHILSEGITGQADYSLSPDGAYMAYVWPFDGGWELRLMALASTHTSILLTQSKGMPLSPAFSPDGRYIYYSEADNTEIKQLFKMPAVGGKPIAININTMDWGQETGRLLLSTKIDGELAPARLSIVDATGHPVAPNSGAVRKEMEHSRVFFYSSGVVEVIAPIGEVQVTAVQGFETPAQTKTFTINKDSVTKASVALERIWDASKQGWYSADTHFHLNYGGSYRLVPDDIVTDIQAEGIDVAIPLLANLQNRFLEQSLWGWNRNTSPIIYFGQEVRSHFLGHIGIFGMDKLFWPWVWGPSYEIYTDDDRSNAQPLQHANTGGGIGGYVHPVAIQNPLTPDTLSSIPIGLVADAVLGHADIIELACLWTDEIGTAAVWHEILNIGVPMAATGGSDVMNNYYHTMPIGSTRVYVKPDGDLSRNSFETALKAGKSVSSNGPMLEFLLKGKGPGEVIEYTSSNIEWTLDVHSVLPLNSIEIYVNGKVVDTIKAKPNTSVHYSGSLVLPKGGWVSARVLGDNTGWPAQDSYLFAQTSPIWINEIGSTSPAARNASAKTLLMVLENARSRLKEGYGDAQIPLLEAHFDKAKTRLESMLD